jgi:hypothetical protein
MVMKEIFCCAIEDIEVRALCVLRNWFQEWVWTGCSQLAAGVVGERLLGYSRLNVWISLHEIDRSRINSRASCLLLSSKYLCIYSMLVSLSYLAREEGGKADCCHEQILPQPMMNR